MLETFLKSSVSFWSFVCRVTVPRLLDNLLVIEPGRRRRRQIFSDSDRNKWHRQITNKTQQPVTIDKICCGCGVRCPQCLWVQQTKECLSGFPKNTIFFPRHCTTDKDCIQMSIGYLFTSQCRPTPEGVPNAKLGH